MLTPSEIRAAITNACEDIEYGKIQEGFQSLMDYIDVDLLVAWFVDEVCAGDSVSDVINDEDTANAIQEWYDLHC